MLKRCACLALAALSTLPSAVHGEGACPPPGLTRERLLEIRQGGFVIEDAGQRNAMAVELLSCVADPDPAIRDGVVYEGLSTWLRGQQLTTATIHALYAELIEDIGNAGDRNGFQQPFAALILSELARTDRVDNTFTPAMRDELVQVAATYLAGVSDYRGFSETEGWRHGVAHGADLVLQLVLDPNIGAAQIQQLMKALAVQVAPVGAVFYIYGEPVRLARAAYYAYVRGVVEESFWSSWLEGIASPGTPESWAASFSSQAGLARRHNTLAFLLALHFNATVGGGDRDAALAERVQQAIGQVSGG